MSVGLRTMKVKGKSNYCLPWSCSWRVLCKKVSRFEYHCHVAQGVTRKKNIILLRAHHRSLPCFICMFGKLSYLFTFPGTFPVRGGHWPFRFTLVTQQQQQPVWGKIPDRQCADRHTCGEQTAEGERLVRREGDSGRMLTCCLASFLTLSVINHCVSF